MKHIKTAADKAVSKPLITFLKEFNHYYYEVIVNDRQSASFLDDLMKYFYTSTPGKELRNTLEELKIRPEPPVPEPIL